MTDLPESSFPKPSRGRLFVLSGPSGVGKGSLLAALLDRVPGIVKSVSATTRLARPGEVDGVDYHFLTREQFVADIAADRFVEYAEYNRNYYGTPLAPVALLRDQGMDVVLEIEVQGAQIVRTVVPDTVLIFIQPPSIETLEERLRKRGSDSEIRIAERLSIATAEISCIPLYDYAIVNDDFDHALDQLRSILVAERCRVPSEPRQ